MSAPKRYRVTHFQPHRMRKTLTGRSPKSASTLVSLTDPRGPIKHS